VVIQYLSVKPIQPFSSTWHDLGLRALPLDEVEFGDVVVADLVELAVDLPDDAFVQDEEILQIVGQAVARDDAVGREAYLGVGGVFDRLGDAEHEVFVDRNVRRKISPAPLSQTSVTGAADASVSPLSTCQGVSAPGTSSKLRSPAGAQP
jgi:hypothetical protein